MVEFGSALYLCAEPAFAGLGALPKELKASPFSTTASRAWRAMSETVSAVDEKADSSVGLVSVLLKRLNAEITALWLRMANGVEEGVAERTMVVGAASARNAALLMKCLGIVN
jgi:hypothetical protein